MYSLVIITHIPVFYKIKLYNEIAKDKKIFVIFVARDTLSKRSDDFLILDEAEFDYDILSGVEIENRNKKSTISNLKKIFKKCEFQKLIVSGWDLIEFWYAAFLNRKSKNILALESTIFESSTVGFKGVLKKLFLSRISLVYASGKLHKELLLSLGFMGDVIITKGVGIIRKPNVKYERSVVKKNRIVYVGRLSSEKNLDVIINTVNKFPWIKLDLYGVGSDNEVAKLSCIAGSNTNFHGAINNTNLQEVFKEADFLILPSLSETWGLVVEEALYFKLPVILSDRCGVSELINEDSGYIFSIDSFGKEFECLLNNYGNTIFISKFNIDRKDNDQILCYIS